ncbi:ATP-binding protein [Streptomyces sp. NBC_00063]|uniref:ATP-binding protein n=1 Tax=Streptomyces sp. NBC_00063 TaxID=2975638 RepID=UPI0022514364|nr:ATP-binding protein [Streptomyces sp. NBC_00063]MCX5437640.1 ATP-binding protein [Streptomyces sp. NBC_00063]
MNDAEITFTIRLSATPRGARLARRLTVQQLVDWTCPFETAELLVAELENNAITHGRVPGRDFRLTLTLTPTDTLCIEVTDARGDTMPREPGYGLLLVEALAEVWGTRLGPPPTKTVWAELRASKPPRPHRGFHDAVTQDPVAPAIKNKAPRERTSPNHPQTPGLPPHLTHKGDHPQLGLR